LYYVVSGSGEFTADGSAERKPAGSVVLEPYGWVHQWANPHHDVTVVVVANVSPAGGPAIVFGTP
jgi:quercetin dioxygenase-like cupin family protein